MTVIPTREQSVINAILSIQQGTMKPDAMYINIPKNYVRFKEKLNPTLIPILRDNLGVRVNEIDEDRACLNKILPTLEFETDPETLIVTMDDDMIYSPLYIQGLYTGWKEFGGVVGFSGISYPETAVKLGYTAATNIITNCHGAQVELLEDGFGTMFKLDCVQGFPYVEPLTDDMDPYFYLSDDYIFCRFFDYKKIPKRVLNWSNLGRSGDDWSSICTGNEDAKTYAISSTRKSYEDFMRAGQKLKEWGWW